MVWAVSFWSTRWRAQRPFGVVSKWRWWREGRIWRVERGSEGYVEGGGERVELEKVKVRL
jgi:hypothetical protein